MYVYKVNILPVNKNIQVVIAIVTDSFIYVYICVYICIYIFLKEYFTMS